MDILSILPHFQASLNAISLVLICMAFIAVKSGKTERHMLLMKSALAVSTVFLISYLYYHANVGHVPFLGKGTIRPVYFTILFSHIIMAAIALVMIIITGLRALKGNFNTHRNIARFTFPVWVFVCVTGIVVYVMAFHLYAEGA